MYIIKNILYFIQQCNKSVVKYWILISQLNIDRTHLQYRSFKIFWFSAYTCKCMWKREKHFNYDKFHFQISKYITCCITLSLRFVFAGVQTWQLHRVYKWHGECLRLKLLYPWRAVGTCHLGRTLIYIWRYRVTWGYL